jgi:hypothetical protein
MIAKAACCVAARGFTTRFGDLVAQRCSDAGCREESAPARFYLLARCAAQQAGRQFGAVMDAEAPAQIGHVFFHGLVRNSHLARDLLVGPATVDPDRDVRRARRQSCRITQARGRATSPGCVAVAFPSKDRINPDDCRYRPFPCGRPRRRRTEPSISRRRHHAAYTSFRNPEPGSGDPLKRI